MTETVGERVRRLRKDRGWSLSAMAKYVHGSKGALSDVENDHQTMTLPRAARIAHALNVTLDELYWGVDGSSVEEPTA